MVGQENLTWMLLSTGTFFIRAESEMFYEIVGCITDSDWRLENFFACGQLKLSFAHAWSKYW